MKKDLKHGIVQYGQFVFIGVKIHIYFTKTKIISSIYHSNLLCIY